MSLKIGKALELCNVSVEYQSRSGESTSRLLFDIVASVIKKWTRQIWFFFGCSRTRSTICVPLVKTIGLILQTFAGIFPSCRPTSSFRRCLMPNVFSQVFCESRLEASSFGRTMMFVNLHFSLYSYILCCKCLSVFMFCRLCLVIVSCAREHLRQVSNYIQVMLRIFHSSVLCCWLH